jgi:hypothetical protein
LNGWVINLVSITVMLHCPELNPGARGTWWGQSCSALDTDGGPSLHREGIDGLYRTLLFQLLRQVPSVQSVLDRLPHLDLTTCKPIFNGWKTETLQHLFEQSVHKVGAYSSLICVIDALDECE